MSKYLRPELVKMDLKGAAKRDVIVELLEGLHEQGRIRDVERALADVLEREAVMTTGLVHGIAIPHARTDEVEHLTCTIGLSKAGVDFQAMDGAPSRIIILTLSPKDAAVPHVQVMAMLSRALDEEGRLKVLAAQTPEEVWRALVESSA